MNINKTQKRKKYNFGCEQQQKYTGNLQSAANEEIRTKIF